MNVSCCQMWYLLISLPLVSSHMIPVSLSSARITARHHTSSIVSTGPHKTSILIVGQYNLYNYYRSIWNWSGLVSNSCVLRPLCLYNDYQSAHSRCSHHWLCRSDEDCIGTTKVLHYRRDWSNFTVANHWVSSFSAALANSSRNFDHTQCRDARISRCAYTDQCSPELVRATQHSHPHPTRTRALQCAAWYTR